jgi:phosphatidylserine/phosphatidylglycerophosphate/cardiolipin synthase-like enzyme
LRRTVNRISEIFDKIINHLFHKYRLDFEPGLNNPAAPALGTFVKTAVRVSNHATESLEWKKAIISSAKQSIELSGNFVGGEAFRDVLDLMEDRMKLYPELQVHLLMSPDLLESEDLEKLNDLQTRYPNQFHFLVTERVYTIVPRPLSEENHVKLLVVDEKYFVTGGTGIHEKMAREVVPENQGEGGSFGSKFIDKAFRDSDLIGRGDVAMTMRNQFYNLYRIWEYRVTGQSESRYFALDVEEEKGVCATFDVEENLINDVDVKFVVGGPEHRGNNPITHEISQLISGAQEEVRLANLLFNPDEEIKESLAQKKRAGVAIKGYFNGTGEQSSAGHYMYALPCRYNYDLLTEAYEYDVRDQLYHKKVTTIDSDLTVIGTANLGVKSAMCDYESICVIRDRRVNGLMKEALDEDRDHSAQFEGAQLATQRSRLAGRVASAVLGPFFG